MLHGRTRWRRAKGRRAEFGLGDLLRETMALEMDDSLEELRRRKSVGLRLSQAFELYFPTSK